jgi:PilZ domain
MTQAPMLKERRKTDRRKVNRVARFYTELGQLPRTCMVTNISDTGARLYSDGEMPQQFFLSVSGEGVTMQRECRVVWRLGGELGVEFVGRAR